MTPASNPSHVEIDDAVVGRSGLTARMRSASFAVAETLFTTEAGSPPEARLVWLCDDLDHFFVHAGPRARFVYRLCLLAISVLAPLFVLRLPPFRRMSRRARTAALERMERSRLGLAVFGAKAILCILYYEHPDAARAVGFDGACLEGAVRPGER